MASRAALADPAPPAPSLDPAAVAAVVAAVTGARGAVQAAWSQIKARDAEMFVRGETFDDPAAFLAAAITEADRRGLLIAFLRVLAANRLTDPVAFPLAVDALLGRDALALLDTAAETSATAAASLLAMTEGDQTAFESLAEANDGIVTLADRAPALVDAARDQARLGERLGQLCRVAVDGVHRGTGVLVRPTLVATAFHVIAPIADAADGLKRLTLVFGDSSVATGPEQVGTLHPDWLVHRSELTAAEATATAAFNLYDVAGVAADPGHWDLALIRLARPPATAITGASLAAAMPRGARFSIQLLHHPAEGGMGLAARSRKSTGFGTGFLVDRTAAAPAPPLRLLHDCQTFPGSSGAPCFDSDWNVVALHQAGMARGATMVGRAVPVERWLPMLEQIPVEDEVARLPVVPSVDGAPAQPVIGRRDAQRRIWRALADDAPATDRLFVVNGRPGRGKTFTARLADAIVKPRGHIIKLVDFMNATWSDAGGSPAEAITARLVGALGLAGDGRDLVSALDGVEPPLWLVLDDIAASGLASAVGVVDLVEALIAALDGPLPRLRLILTGWTRFLPGRHAPAENLDAEPTAADILDYALLRFAPGGFRLDAGMRTRCLAAIEARRAPAGAAWAEADERAYERLLGSVAPVFTAIEGAVTLDLLAGR